MKLSVFVGTSLDGFIARRNGRYDFLPAGGGEPHGYDEFIASVDTILIGRNTFEVVLKLPRWPYSDKRVVVLSHRPLDFSGVTGRVEQMSGDPGQIAHELAATGAKLPGDSGRKNTSRSRLVSCGSKDWAALRRPLEDEIQARPGFLPGARDL